MRLLNKDLNLHGYRIQLTQGLEPTYQNDCTIRFLDRGANFSRKFTLSSFHIKSIREQTKMKYLNAKKMYCFI